MAPIVRFAPSPTGNIHIGNTRTALINWLFAKSQGGQFILRYDDTDQARSKQEYVDTIAADLAWLGVTPDRVEFQSKRVAAHEAATQKLKDMGRLYACYETGDELDSKRKRQRALGRPPIYDRAALQLTDAEKAAFEAEGRKPHWRFLLDQQVETWVDGVRGEQSIDCASLSDPVLIREDGSFLYTLPSIVDDIDMNVTHVIRGEDHVANTAVQMQLFRILGDSTPDFAHHNLMTDETGAGLSKRLGSIAIKSMRAEGYEPIAAACMAVLTGSSEALRVVDGMDELMQLFSFDKISRAPARFEMATFKALNAKFLHLKEFKEVERRLHDMGIDCPQDFWLAVRENLEILSDAKTYWPIVQGPIEPVIEDTAFVAHASELLPAEPWDATTWKTWTDAVKAATGAKGKALFMPLRKAITGLEHGPELAGLLPLIGRQKISARLAGKAE
jgi:glutamyl-tRNA synthetase